MKAIRDRLWVKSEVGGIARYEHDYYHHVEKEKIDVVPGNPWVICTLWQAQHRIAVSRTISELEHALEYLNWVNQRALESGVLAEQFHPYTGETMSVSPLTWSHATVMIAVMQYLLRHAELSGRRAGALAELVNPVLDAAI
jgi:GH15 family glucan-1,4-alpha-glucosidase